MSKIKEYKMGKGRTTRPGDAEEWNRKYLEITIELPPHTSEEDLQESMTHTEYILDNWVSQQPVPQVPELDATELDDLPWKDRNKKPAKDGKWGWIFGPESDRGVDTGAETLSDALLHTKGHKMVIGDMEYSLSGNKAFINRSPIKKKED